MKKKHEEEAPHVKYSAHGKHYTMSHEEGNVEGEGYEMEGSEGQGKKFQDFTGYDMAGPGMESTKVEKSPESDKKGKMQEDRD